MVGYSHPQYESTTPIFQDNALKIANRMKKMSVFKLMESYSCSEKIALENSLRFNNFGKENYHAIYTYTGHQFKNMNPLKFSEEEIRFLQNHLVILSGLYGVLRPLDAISLYRLPMDFKLNEKKISSIYLKKIRDYFYGETVINLASQEYSSVISKQTDMISIDFLYEKDGKLKTDSMEAKKMRGLFVRYIAKNKINCIENLKCFDQFGYNYNEHFSSEKLLVFLKK